MGNRWNSNVTKDEFLKANEIGILQKIAYQALARGFTEFWGTMISGALVLLAIILATIFSSDHTHTHIRSSVFAMTMLSAVVYSLVGAFGLLGDGLELFYRDMSEKSQKLAMEWSVKITRVGYITFFIWFASLYTFHYVRDTVSFLGVVSTGIECFFAAVGVSAWSKNYLVGCVQYQDFPVLHK